MIGQLPLICPILSSATMTPSSPSPIRLIIGTGTAKRGRDGRAHPPPWDSNPHLARLLIGSLADHPEVPDVVEDAETFTGNARKKASETARTLRSWVLADDSGLAVDALNGAPGVYPRATRVNRAMMKRTTANCSRRSPQSMTAGVGPRSSAISPWRTPTARSGSSRKGPAAAGSPTRARGSRIRL